jgi:hypothetical protein
VPLGHYERPVEDLPGVAKVDPPPEEFLPFRPIPEQLARQGGVGGWFERPHPRADTTTEWEGRPLHTMSFDWLFDAIRRGNGDVEAQLATLHRWGLPVNRADPKSEPPRLQVRYGHGQQLRWVIDNLDYLDEQRNGAGRRVQALVRVSLLEYRSPRLAFTPVQQAAATGAVNNQQGVYVRPGDGTRTYTVRAGDTLTSIASRQLHDPTRWREICELNSLPSCDLITAGQILKLPAA